MIMLGPECFEQQNQILNYFSTVFFQKNTLSIGERTKHSIQITCFKNTDLLANSEMEKNIENCHCDVIFAESLQKSPLALIEESPAESSDVKEKLNKNLGEGKEINIGFLISVKNYKIG